ncbi:MAG: ABC transporter ATP-binding protein [Verrucomicrobiales bacterium]|nr:ABC transporter ATP-binding protein [Verrucomicrobiales bacterium]
MKFLRRLVSYARVSPRLAVTLLVLTILDSFWAPVFPVVTSKIQNEVIPNRDFQALWFCIGLVLAVGLVRDLMSFVRTRTSGKLGQLINFNLRAALYGKLQRLPVRWFDRQRTGDIMTRIADDVPAMERVINEGMETFVRLLFQVIAVAGTLFWTNVPLTLVAMIPIPFLILAGYFSTNPMRAVYRRSREAHSELNSLVNDNLGGIRQIKAYHLLDAELRRFNGASETVRQANLRVNLFWAVFSPIVGSTVALGYTLVLAYGAYLCMKDQPTLKAGDLSTYLLLLWAFYDPIQRLKDLHQMLQNAQTSADRVFAIIDTEDEADLSSGQRLSELQGLVRFDRVNFSYGEKPTLNAVSLEANPGETVALVGSSGAGKSTILYLLARFYEYDSGSIQVDGHELKSLAKDSWRTSLGYVTQEAFLFNGTIRDNLRIARLDATDDDLWTALRAANAETFVRRQPEALDTEVGERGVRLSGGEKQRISIARVLLKNPAILLLDEATASVDNETERLIQEALDRLMRNRTAFVIAHRLSTIRNAHRIYVMDQGAVVESGTHNQLVSQGGLYWKLCQTAFREEDSGKSEALSDTEKALPFRSVLEPPTP